MIPTVYIWSDRVKKKFLFGPLDGVMSSQDLLSLLVSLLTCVQLYE